MQNAIHKVSSIDNLLNPSKRKPSQDYPRDATLPREKYAIPSAMTPVDEVMQRLCDTTINTSPALLDEQTLNLPPVSDLQRILNSTDYDAEEIINVERKSIIPKEQRPPQPDSQREYFERMWSQNFARSNAAVDVVKGSSLESMQLIPVGSRASLVQVNGFSLARNVKSGKLYTVFRIEMENEYKAKRWTIYRRYQDFKELATQLRELGYRVPVLPPKTLLRSFGNEFLRKRQADLQKWLFEVLSPTMDGHGGLSFTNFTADILDSDVLRYFLTHHANEPPQLEETMPAATMLRNDSAGSDTGSSISSSSTSNVPSPLPFPTTEELSAKLTVDDFRLIRVVGKGSFGKVLLVQKKDSQELFAMKILSKPSVVKKNQVEHTRTERRVLGSVRHPFIVGLHYAFQTSKKLYFILDYCPGGDMFFHLSRYGCFPEIMAKFYAAEIALALVHLHELGVIYRDLKPENIMLDKDGHVKLADFGLAKEGITSDAEGTFTMCGTPEYLPPEILNRNGHGKAVDWWNLGMVLYELLTGRPPWYTTDRMKLFLRLRNAKLEFPSGMSPEAMSFIEGLLNRNPMQRLGSQSPEQILKHPFFNGVNWRKLYNREVRPPYLPSQTSDPESTINFEPAFTQIPVEEDEEATSIGHVSTATPSGRGSAARALSYTFQGFTYEGIDDKFPVQ